MFVGEAPGRFGADRTGTPFYGDRSGTLLRKVLEDLREARAGPLRIYVTNAVKCNPRDLRDRNRPPTSAELCNCSSFLLREIVAVRPRVIVPLGRRAMAAIAGRVQYDWWVPIPGSPLVFPAKHPGYVVRGGGSERLTASEYSNHMRAVLQLLR